MIDDIWQEQLYDGRFGIVPLDIVVTQDSIKRSLPAMSMVGRSGAVHQDQGLEARDSRVRIVFWERPGDPNDPIDQLSHVERFAAFDQEQRKGARDFTHPIFGTYRAYVRSYTVDAAASEPNVLVIDCEMVEDGLDPRGITSPGDPVAGAASVSTAAAGVDLAVAGIPDFELTKAADGTTVSTAAVSKVTAWETDPSIGTEKIDGDLSDLSLRMAHDSSRLEAKGTDAMPAIRALNILHSSVRLAAQARQRDQPTIVDYLMPATMPLRALISQLYYEEGGDQAELYDAIMRLNRIEDPLMVPAGRTLRRPSANPRGINSLSGVR